MTIFDTQGVELWKSSYETLREALEEAVAAGADLTCAQLDGAKLRGATLRWVNLTGADLTGANLIGADFTGANLIGVDLTGADLTGADFTGANLIGVKPAAPFPCATGSGTRLRGGGTMGMASSTIPGNRM